MKYSINGTGNIVAERDIYSLGGFIPKGTVGGKIASEAQLSQDGDCWLASGGIENSPQVRISDNAYVGGFVEAGVVHTDNEVLISGDTLIPGQVNIRSLQIYAKSNIYVKDSFIGVTMDVLCGPEATASAFPFGQGSYNSDAAKGTLFENMVVTPIPINICRSFADLRLGKDTYLYIPTGYNCRVLWAYYDTSNKLAYSGESTPFAAGLHKLNHPVYKVARMHIAKVNGTAMTPADLLATGAKILGHVSGSVQSYLNAISASGNYVMDNCQFAWAVTDFSFSSNGRGIFSGSMRNCNVRGFGPYDLNVCGKFSNIEQLDLYRMMQSPDYTDPNRDTFITASDCPLLRVTTDFQAASLKAMGNLVLRRCIVPKATFDPDPVNGDTYEDIDFSYAIEDLGFSMPGYAVLSSSHKQGLYRVRAGVDITQGLVSHKGSLADTGRLYPKIDYIPLDGNIMEQGYFVGSAGMYYEDMKANTPDVVRTARPVSTIGLAIPTLPAGYLVRSIYYFTEDFKLISRVSAPTSVDTTKPYAMLDFWRDGGGILNASDFIALNRKLAVSKRESFPEITGSAYVGEGVTVRGDVQLHGDPYVNRLLDVNLWERGENTMVPGQTWADGKNLTNRERHFEFKEAVPVEAGGTLSAASGYFVYAGWMDEDKRILSTSGVWAASFTVPANAKYVGLVLKKAASAAAVGGLIEDSDIPLANVKYLRAFEKRRYITNELDRTSPKDILIGPDYWEQGGLSIAEGNAGKPYEELKIGSPYRIRLKRPLGLGAGYRVTFSSVYAFATNYYDAATKLLFGYTSVNMNNALFALVGSVADSPTAVITPEDVTAARLVIEFTPTPRIAVPYGSATLTVNGMRIRMYDNAVLSRNLNQQGEIVLQGDAVMGYDFNSGSCMCSNGHSDAIIKLP
nr:MAG TPA: Putative transferase, nesg, ydcK, Structural Genomics.38A [Caudoviricetes sp.]